MTYCVGLKINEGLVFMSDTLTNAGVDNINRTRKMENCFCKINQFKMEKRKKIISCC